MAFPAMAGPAPCSDGEPGAATSVDVRSGCWSITSAAKRRPLFAVHRSWTVRYARRTEARSEAVGGFTVSLGGRLGVDGQRRPGVGVAEPGLGDLDVDALVQQRCTGGVPTRVAP